MKNKNLNKKLLNETFLKNLLDASKIFLMASLLGLSTQKERNFHSNVFFLLILLSIVKVDILASYRVYTNQTFDFF